MSETSQISQRSVQHDGSESTNDNVEYYLSDVFQKLGYSSREELESSLDETFNALYSSNISVKQNFKQVFRFNDGKMYTDWKISPLAYNFLKLNPVV